MDGYMSVYLSLREQIRKLENENNDLIQRNVAVEFNLNLWDNDDEEDETEFEDSDDEAHDKLLGLEWMDQLDSSSQGESEESYEGTDSDSTSTHTNERIGSEEKDINLDVQSKRKKVQTKIKVSNLSSHMKPNRPLQWLNKDKSVKSSRILATEPLAKHTTPQGHLLGIRTKEKSLDNSYSEIRIRESMSTTRPATISASSLDATATTSIPISKVANAFEGKAGVSKSKIFPGLYQYESNYSDVAASAEEILKLETLSNEKRIRRNVVHQSFVHGISGVTPEMQRLTVLTPGFAKYI